MFVECVYMDRKSTGGIGDVEKVPVELAVLHTRKSMQHRSRRFQNWAKASTCALKQHSRHTHSCQSHTTLMSNEAVNTP